MRRWKPLVLMGSELPFPFRARPSTILVPGMPDEAIGCMPLLDEWGVPSRLATLAGFAGCFDGYVTELARAWLRSLDAAAARRDRDLRLRPDADAGRHAPRWRANSSCPARWRSRNSWPARSAAVPAARWRCTTSAGAAMKRVCVDGPVFEAADAVFPAA